MKDSLAVFNLARSMYRHRGLTVPQCDCVDIMFNGSGAYPIHFDHGMNKIGKDELDRYEPWWLMFQLFIDGSKVLVASMDVNKKTENVLGSIPLEEFQFLFAYNQAAMSLPHGALAVGSYAILVFRASSKPVVEVIKQKLRKMPKAGRSALKKKHSYNKNGKA